MKKLRKKIKNSVGISTLLSGIFLSSNSFAFFGDMVSGPVMIAQDAMQYVKEINDMVQKGQQMYNQLMEMEKQAENLAKGMASGGADFFKIVDSASNSVDSIFGQLAQMSENNKEMLKILKSGKAPKSSEEILKQSQATEEAMKDNIVAVATDLSTRPDNIKTMLDAKKLIIDNLKKSSTGDAGKSQVALLEKLNTLLGYSIESQAMQATMAQQTLQMQIDRNTNFSAQFKAEMQKQLKESKRMQEKYQKLNQKLMAQKGKSMADLFASFKTSNKEYIIDIDKSASAIKSWKK